MRNNDPDCEDRGFEFEHSGFEEDPAIADCPCCDWEGIPNVIKVRSDSIHRFEIYVECPECGYEEMHYKP